MKKASNMSEKNLKTGLGNFDSKNCVTCGYMLESHFFVKRCQGCHLGVVEPTMWYPQDTVPSDEDSERLS